MELNRNEEFLKKLITLSKEKKMKWEYLDSNDELCDKMNFRTYNPFAVVDYDYDFDKTTSFFSYQKNNNVYLILIKYKPFNNEKLELLIVPNTYRGTLSITSDDYMELLIRLKNTIKSQFPNPDDFIDAILKM